MRKRVLSHLGKKPEPGEKGIDRYWNVLFIGRNLKGSHFEWKLRPDLEEAIHELYPELGNDEVNEELDANLIRNAALSSSNAKVLTIDRKRPEPGVVKGITVYPRNRQYSLLALEKADHKCKVEGENSTFTRRADGLPYTEPHHLIPMARQGEFNVSIDVPENIVSLCSNCHNEIHYGADVKKILTRLFESRKEELREAGINISLEKILSYYK